MRDVPPPGVCVIVAATFAPGSCVCATAPAVLAVTQVCASVRVVHLIVVCLRVLGEVCESVVYLFVCVRRACES